MNLYRLLAILFLFFWFVLIVFSFYAAVEYFPWGLMAPGYILAAFYAWNRFLYRMAQESGSPAGGGIREPVETAEDVVAVVRRGQDVLHQQHTPQR